jgi:hypothetical protein
MLTSINSLLDDERKLSIFIGKEFETIKASLVISSSSVLRVPLVEVVAEESEDIDLCNMLMVDVCEKRTFRRTWSETNDGEESSSTGTTDECSVSGTESPLQMPPIGPLLGHVKVTKILPKTSKAEHAPISSIDSICPFNFSGDMGVVDCVLYLLQYG